MATQRSAPVGPRRVFLHVGSPKTGTTFLQQVLWSQRERAAEQGVHLPLERFNDHFLASLDIRGMTRPPHPPAAQGMWSRLVADCANRPGTALVSHELFAAANRAQARRATTAFDSGVEVHVVLTARDLLRQLSAEWQEHVKHRATLRYDEFVATVREKARERSGWFWLVQDYVRVLERWGDGLPADRVHLVTVPPSGAPPDLLWQRFAGLLGLQPGSFDTSTSRTNTSLGVEQTEVLRRVNEALGDRLAIPGPYPMVVKDVLAHQVLGARPGSRLTLGVADTEFAVEQSQLLSEGLAAAGIDVVGSLDELVPHDEALRSTVSATAGQSPADEVLLRESIAAIADLLVELSERTERHRIAVEMSGALREAPLRAALVELSEQHPPLMGARQAWRRARERR